MAFNRCGHIFNQWLYVTCGRSVSETEFQWRNMSKKYTNSREFPIISIIVSFTLTYSCFRGIILLYWGENNNNIPHWTLVQLLLPTIELRCNLNKRPAARRIVKIFIDRAKKTCYNDRRYSEFRCSPTKTKIKTVPTIRGRFLGLHLRPKRKEEIEGHLVRFSKWTSSI